MDNFQLERILDDTLCNGRNRVIASDQLPTRTRLEPSTLRVVNLDVSGQPGTHWVLFYVASNGTVVYYFDSLGLCPTAPGNIGGFLQLYDRVESNRGFNVQSYVDSNTCGVHCIYVATKLCKGRSLDQALSSYVGVGGLDDSEDTTFNECMALVSVMKTHLKRHPRSFDRIKGCL
jgi:hypothetical protein